MRLSSASFRSYWSQVKNKDADGKDLAGLKFFEGAPQTDEQPVCFHARAVDAPPTVPQEWKFGEYVYVTLPGSADSIRSECTRSALKFSRLAQCADGPSEMLLFCPQSRPVEALAQYSIPPTADHHEWAGHACYLVPAEYVFKAESP